MTEEKKHIEKKLKIDQEKFAAAMDKLATDKVLQEKLDKHPLEALEDLGIQVDEETREALKGKNFMEAMGVSEKEAAAYVQPVVEVKPIVVQPLVNARVVALTGTITLPRPRPLPVPNPNIMIRNGPIPIMIVGPGSLTATSIQTGVQTGVVTPTEAKGKKEKDKTSK